MHANRRGQVFMLWIVVVTITLCVIAFTVHSSSKPDLYKSLVSPHAVLEVQDELAVFELRERAALMAVLKTLDGEDFGSDSFVSALHSGFIAHVLESEEMRSFIFADLYVDGKDMGEQAQLVSKSFIQNRLYPASGFEAVGEKIFVSRSKVGKHEFLKGSESARNAFPVGFYFEFDRAYSIKKSDSEYVIEVVGV